MKTKLFLLAVILSVLTSVQAQTAGVLDAARAYDWHDYSGIPTYSLLGTLPSDSGWTQCGPTVSAYGSSGTPGSVSTIVNAMQHTSAGYTGCGLNTYVKLGVGTFFLSAGGNVVGMNQDELRGSGPTQTKLVFSAGGPCIGSGGGICLLGFSATDTTYGGSGPTYTVASGTMTQGATTFTVASGANIVANKTMIVLTQCDTGFSGAGCATGSSINNGGWFNASAPYVPAANDPSSCTVTGGTTVTGTGFSANFGSTILLTISAVVTSVPFTFGSSTTGTLGSSVTNGTYSCSFPTGVSFNDNNGGFSANRRWQMEVFKAVSCSPACGTASSTVLTLDHPIQRPNWSSTQTPEIFLIQPSFQLGIRDLAMDCSATQGCGHSNDLHGVALFNIDEGWARNVVITNTGATGFYLWNTYQSDVSSNYVYNPGQQNVGNDPSGLNFSMFNTVFANNIIHNAHVLILGNASSLGNVIAYNYGVNTFTGDGFLFGGIWDGHSNGADMQLFEGNVAPQMLQDQTHGSHIDTTLYRNFLYGWESCANGNCGANTAKTNSVVAIENLSGNVLLNVIDNVLGTPGVTTVGYSVTQPDWNVSGTTGYAFNIGSGNGCVAGSGCVGGPIPANPFNAITDYRWANWDAFNAATRYVTSEVPSGISTFPQSVPTTTCTASLPCPTSFYWTGGKPAWYGAEAWPPIGSDVTSGNVGQCSGTLNTPGKFAGLAGTSATQCGAGNTLGLSAWAGHINATPAWTYYLTLGGNLDGTSTQLLNFDANVGYAPVTNTFPTTLNPTGRVFQ